MVREDQKNRLYWHHLAWIINMSLWYFHNKVSRWFSSGGWATTSLLRFSEYSGQSHQFCSLYSPEHSIDLQFLLSIYQVMGNTFWCINDYYYHPYYHYIPLFFCHLARSKYFPIFFTCVFSKNSTINQMTRYFCCLLIFWGEYLSICI